MAAVEVTTLDAQTHLWNPTARAFSSLVAGQGWKPLFPPLRRAWDVLGPVRPAVAAATGLPADTPVLCGIHDSNANYLRYLAAGLDDFTLMSTGTWVISFNTAQPLDALYEDRDTVANVDVTGRPVACSRFMGGREYAVLAGEDRGTAATLDDVAQLIAAGTMALPSFTDSGGPLPGTGGKGRVTGPQPATAARRTALATLYTALMSSLSIDLIGSANDIVIDGGFAGNALFCRLIAALRPGQTVRVSPERDGTALGAALLWRWADRDQPVPQALDTAAAPRIAGLDDYAADWRPRAEAVAE